MSATEGWGTLSDGSTVPEEIARMGIFLHMLADRCSHFYCTDIEGESGIFETDEGTLDTSLSPKWCNAVFHASQHSWEQAVEKPLAPQSYSALSLAYQEPLSFRELVETKHLEWFVRRPVPYDNLVGTPANPGLLDSAFVIRDAQDRFNQILSAERPPGFAGGSTKKCRFPKKLEKVRNPEDLITTSGARLAIQYCTGIPATDVVALTGQQYSKQYGKKGLKDTLYISFTPNVEFPLKEIKDCEEYFCRYASLIDSSVKCSTCRLRGEPCLTNADCCKEGKCVDIEDGIEG